MLNNRNTYREHKKIWTLFSFVMITILLLSGCGTAQQSKVYHIGILTDNLDAIGDGFKAKMTELGYIEGQNVVYEMRKAPANADSAEELRLAKELVAANVDLIFSFPAPPTVAAYQATQGTKIPVVFAYYQIEGSEFVKSVREPGGNITGVRYPGTDLYNRRLVLLHEIAPQVKRLWIGYDKNGPNTKILLDVLRPAAAEAGITLVEVPATKMEDLGADLAARAASADLGIDAILTMADNFNTSPAGFAVLSKFAAEHKLPVAGGTTSQIENGALFINGTNNENVGALAAPLADKIFKGVQAGTIPVVTPEQTLIINYKTAQLLGLTIPDNLLKQADKIIR